MVQHDVSSEHLYSRIYLVKGTKGMAVKYPKQLIALGDSWLNEEKMANAWSSIAPLSEWSVANRSQSIDVPDFTGGS
jgi:hypothetical protein